jgi:hypothetical protein
MLELNTEVLSLKEVMKILSPIIDDGSYQMLDLITAESRGMQELSAFSLLETTRHDTVAIVSNGVNTIAIVDFDVETRRITRHDPIIKITGRDSLAIAKTLISGIRSLLIDRLVEFTAPEAVVKDISRIDGKPEEEIQKEIDKVHEEARLALRERLHAKKT